MQTFCDSTSENSLINALENLDNENRLVTTPWSRIVRGLGLGQYPMNFSKTISGWIQDAFDELKEKTEYKNSYVNFSSRLCDLIYLLVKPNQILRDSDRQIYIFDVLSLINNEPDPYHKIMQYSITIDALAKLNINLFDLMENFIDLPDLLFKNINAIKSSSIENENSGKHGNYEKLSAYTSIFFALASCDKKDVAVSYGKDYIDDALKTLENIPSPFLRGRGGSMLFCAISLLGYSKVLFSNGRDYITEMLDYLDDTDLININPSFPQEMTPDFIKIYPLLTLLNAIAATRHYEALNYKQDRILQVNVILEALTPIERTHMGLYYVMALYNLGLIVKEEKNVNKLINELIHTATNIDPSDNYFLTGIANSYVIETSIILGKKNLITEDLVKTLVNSFLSMNKNFDDEINRPYPIAYALTILGEAGHIDKLFTPSVHYGNKSAISWMINNLVQIGDNTDNKLYMFNNALINLMLRMRGKDFPVLDVYKKFSFKPNENDILTIKI
uniref:Uncharacterized protein n=1 Tax=Acinetobacter larvae TaxID=1789224 RepID=A0A1J0RI68_9GAMM|nr:hypothetical protein [Acinetobacter larvae]APD77623.1 hypothetical protein BFG52_16605 [Acinetobacter larvae]